MLNHDTLLAQTGDVLSRLGVELPPTAGQPDPGLAGTVLIARPASSGIGAQIVLHETVAQFVPVLKSKLADTPDPPPPKLFC